MAMTAWLRAKRLANGDVIGLGCTAAIATNRERRGEDRCHIAVQTDVSTLELNAILAKGLSRDIQENLCAELILDVVAQALSLGDEPCGSDEVELTVRKTKAPPEWQTLVCGKTNKTTNDSFEVLFPGAFNPMHEGHRNIINHAREFLDKEVYLEVSIRNVDKPPLDFLEMEHRQNSTTGYQLVFTNAPTFVEKSAIFPDSTFLVGTDTVSRIADSRYYGGDIRQRDAAIDQIAANGSSFLVFGRLLADQFTTLDEVDIPDTLRVRCTQVDEAKFREDVSSTVLREQQGHATS